MSGFTPETLFIEQDAADLPLCRQIVERCPGVPVERVPSARQLIGAFRDMPDAFGAGKRALLLCRNRGRFLEPCPGTRPAYLCCRYAILNTGTGCPLDCSYCVLQAYLNNPLMTLFVNTADMLAELETHPLLRPGGVVRIGTGEYMDSLALEHLTDGVRTIAPFLERRPELVLELKTKTVCIDHLLDREASGSFIVSWSLNAPAIAAAEEQGAAPVAERIAAARQLVERGYRVGFHFDPLIWHPDWQAGYREVIDLLARRIPSRSIAWISLGSLRYMPRLKQIAQERFHATSIYTGEFICGLDGKMRYLQDIRLEMYRSVAGWLRDYDPDLCVYFCMEHPCVWRQTLGCAPRSNSELKQLLDRRV
jgi:spore photoproduct lyase